MTIQRNAKLIELKKNHLFTMQEQAREKTKLAGEYSRECNRLEKEIRELESQKEEDES